MATQYIVPAATPANPYDDALVDAFHEVIKGITGIADGRLIRPRWQPEPPNQPPFNVNWVAFGISVVSSDVFAFQGYDPDLGYVYEKDEKLKLLHSFYGPNGGALAAQYKDGLQISQNRDSLTAIRVGLIEVQDVLNLPALLKEKWVERKDFTAYFRRRVVRAYPVPYLVGGSIGLDNEQYITEITITDPNP